MTTTLKQLFEKYLDNKCSDEEVLSLLSHFKLGEQEHELKDLIMQALQRSNDPGITIHDLDLRLENIYELVRQRTQGSAELPVKTIKLWQRMAAAVAVLACIAIGVYFFKASRHPELISGSQYANDIAPGKSGATLTLSNGKKIRLADAVNGEVAKEAGIVVKKTAVGQLVYEVQSSDAGPDKFNTLNTAKGETYMLILPDKSKVWLNAASSLTYVASLNDHGKRVVKLSGEAYFEVFKDKSHPFMVESNDQTVEVLGTHFNVHAYADEQLIKTTLLEGSVKVSEKDNSKILVPGQEAVNTRDRIEINAADTELAVAWKNNKFVFMNQSIENVMKMVERWYDVEVVYQGEMPADKFRGSVSRFDNVSKVLQVLERTGSVHFKIEGRRIYVSR